MMRSSQPVQDASARVDRARESPLNSLLRNPIGDTSCRNPTPETTVCYADGQLEEGARLISGKVVEPLEAPRGGCDLVVARDPADGILAAAWDALKDGGVCYVEWTNRRLGPSTACAKLRRHGFHVAAFWPWRSVSKPFCWVPIDARGARRYFIATRSRFPTALPPSALIADTSLRLAHSAGLLRFLCTVARKPAALSTPAAVQSDGMPGVVAETMLEGWDRWGLGPRPRRLSWLMLTGGERSISKCVGLVFSEPDAHPRVAVKLARVMPASAGLDHELFTLQEIERLHPGGIAGVPRPLFRVKLGETIAIGETALVGGPIYSVVTPDRFGDLAARATEWLITLARRTSSQPRAAWWERIAEPALIDFERSFGSVLGTETVDEIRRAITDIGDLPLVCEQRDFSPWNVLIGEGGQLIVLDWESSEPLGLPFLDLIYFLTYSRSTSMARWSPVTSAPRIARSRFFNCDWRRRRKVSGADIAEVGVDRRFLPALRLLTWLIHSRSVPGPWKPTTAVLRPGRPSNGVCS